MKAAQVSTVVKLPLEEVAREVASSHSINLPLREAKVEGNNLVLEFGSADDTLSDPISTTTARDRRQRPVGEPLSSTGKRRRRTGRRNRMKTRGWNVVTKITNSHGQTATIYEPFVSALRGVTGPRRAKEKLVSGILRANGNKPGRESVKYYLENTLEFLEKEAGR